MKNLSYSEQIFQISVKKKWNIFSVQLTVIVLLIYPLKVLSQMGMAPYSPKEGFIITASSDTVLGKINYTEMTGKYMSEIKFTDMNDQKTVYKAADLKGIGIKNKYFQADNVDNAPLEYHWDFYEIRPHPKKQTLIFIQRISNGRLKVFINRNSTPIIAEKSKINGISFSSSEEGLIIEPTYVVTDRKCRFSSYYIEKDHNAMFLLDKNNYASYWADLFGDCFVIQDEIDHNPDLKKFRNFLIAVELYNYYCPVNDL